MKLALRNFWRNRRISAIAAGVVLLFTFFLLLFCSSITTYQAELADSYQSLEATARIASPTSTERARLTDEKYHAILDSGFVASYSTMAQYDLNNMDVLRGLSSPDIDPSLRDCIEEVTWAAGYDPSVLAGNEMVCLVPANLRIEPGTEVSFFVHGKTYFLQTVGVYGNRYASWSNGSAYYCPLNTLKAIYADAGLELTYCGMEMQLQKLSQLDDFKTKMKALGLTEGEAQLVINDSQVQSVTVQMKRQVRLLQALLPVLLALIAGIGFGLSFLLLRGRKREAAVMRSLGMKRKEVFSVLLLENVFQAALGEALGSLLVIALLGIRALLPVYLAVLLVCYLLGGAAAVWKLSGINVFNIMTAKE